MKTRWYKEAVFYQIYPRSFYDTNGDGIGDIQGIISKLDYIKELGVTAIWLSPVYKSPNNDNGYDISDYRDIMDEFGTLDDWKEMIKEIHKRDMKLIMDLVVNHSSNEHKWFLESKKSKDNPYRDYYIWRKGRGKNGKKKPNNWVSNFLGPAWTYDETTEEFYLHLFAKEQPDLNWDNPKLRQEVADICNYWLELGIDGFRCDVIPYIAKPDGLPNSKALHPIRGAELYTLAPNWFKYIKELGDNSYNLPKYDTLVVGEGPFITVDKVESIVKESKGLLDSVFQFDHMNCHLRLQALPRRNINLRAMKKIFKSLNDMPHDCWNSLFYENHDYPRSPSFLANDKEYKVESAKMLAASYLLQRATPYIYQGQEIGMVNYNFKADEFEDVLSINVLKLVKKIAPFLKGYAVKALNNRGRDNARTPIPWNDSENAGFTTGKPWFMLNPNYKEINVEKAMNEKDSVYHFYKDLIAIRKENSKLIRDGDTTTFMDKSKEIFAYIRSDNKKKLLVICNFSHKNIAVDLPSDLTYKSASLLLANYPKDNLTSIDNNIYRAYETRIYELK